MTAGGRSFLILGAAALLMASCATMRREEVGEAVTARGGQATESTEPLHPEPAAPTVSAAPEPEAEPPADAQASTTTFVATEDLYKKTFDEVQKAVAELTRIIAAGDYDQWVASLTADYVRITGSAESLQEASSAQVLKKNGIVLRTLRDYFEYVVMPSRDQVSLEEITFVDATHVKAITQMQSRRIILYYLVREDDRWKVGMLPDGEN